MYQSKRIQRHLASRSHPQQHLQQPAVAAQSATPNARLSPGPPNSRLSRSRLQQLSPNAKVPTQQPQQQFTGVKRSQRLMRGSDKFDQTQDVYQSNTQQQYEQENSEANRGGMKRRKMVDEERPGAAEAKGIATPGSLLGKALTEVTEFSSADKQERQALMEIDQAADEEKSASADDGEAKSGSPSSAKEESGSDDDEEAESEEEEPTMQERLAHVELQCPSDGGAGVNFSYYTRQMLGKKEDIFSKKPLLQISKLRLTHRNTSKIEHIVENKLSDKMNRRDYQFYDLYKNHADDEDVQKAEAKGIPIDDILKGASTDPVTKEEENEPIYGDLEVEFEKLYHDCSIVGQSFGQSLTVRLEVDAATGQVERHVTEDDTKVRVEGMDASMSNFEKCVSEYQPAHQSHWGGATTLHAGGASKAVEVDSDAMMDNHELHIMNRQLLSLEHEFKKPRAEICRIFVAVCGKVERIRDYLEGKTPQIWNALEDLALTELETSHEYRVLLAAKGLQAIKERRNFLECVPVIQHDTVKTL